MAKEIERKYLVSDLSFLKMAKKAVNICQGYISTNPDCTIRLRITDTSAFLTIKGRNKGVVRDEWEYAIPIDDAKEMLEKSTDNRFISKTRYIVEYKGTRWEIDRFHGHLEGLILAEVELPTPDTPFSLPPFIGKEVSNDPRYYNSNLVKSELMSL